MRKKIIIRFSKREDLCQLPWLYKQYYTGEDEGLATDVEGMYAEWDNLSNNEDHKFVSALDGDKLIGFCSVVVNHDIVEKQRPMLMLWNLRVHPDYRKNGVGRDMLKFVEDFGKTINALFVFLGCAKDNTGAQRFYKKIGYEDDFGFYKLL